jgi:Flp pilus assembly protein TadD
MTSGCGKLSDIGDLPGAIVSLREAIRLKPEEAEAHCKLGRILSAQGGFDEA